MSTSGIKILLFGIITEKAGTDRIFLQNVNSTDELKAALLSEFPQLAKMKYLISVDRCVVQQNEPITSDCEVALLPPYSGG